MYIASLRDAVEHARVRVEPLLEPVLRVASDASRRIQPATRLLALAAALLAPFTVVFRSSFLPRTAANKKLRRTAYLDGMRGFAALLVFFMHHCLWAHAFAGGSEKLENVFGWNGEYYFGALPLVRNLFTGGHFAVSTFFVLSGYVLSVKPLTLINAGEVAALGDNVASALFRRWLRLYLPIIIITFCYVLMVHIPIWTQHLKPEGNLRDEIWKWYCDEKNMFFIFDTGNRVFLDYQPHVWSIPVEFKGSIVIYTTLTAVSRMSRTGRWWCLIGLWYYMMYIVDGAYFAMFLGGMLICDLELAAESGHLPKWMYRLAPMKTQIFYSMFAISMWLSGIPSNKNDLQHMRASPGWYWMSFLKPQAVFDYRWFFFFWAASFVVASTPHIPWLKRFFETRFCQHLGRISYMLYLLHGPVLWTIGDRLYAAMGWVMEVHILNIPRWANAFPLPRWGIYGMEINYLIPLCILLPLTLWLAEIATIIIDDNAITFTSWLYRQFLPEKPSKGEIDTTAAEKSAS